jgi:truncated hemoglobin YjbI
MESLEEIDKVTSNISQLHDAIVEYTEIIEKARSTVTLSNYHKHFQHKLKTRNLKIKQNILAKVDQLIPPGIGTDHKVNLYSFLLSQSLTKKLLIPIIDTLFLSKSYPSPIYIHNSESNFISIIKGPDSTPSFLSMLRARPSSGYPSCTFKPDDGKILLFHSAEALQDFLISYSGVQGMAQRFVSSRNDHISLLRVHWKRDSKPKAYFIGNNHKISPLSQNKLPPTAVHKKNRSITPSTSTPTKISKPDTAIMQYANQLIWKNDVDNIRKLSVMSEFDDQKAESVYSPLPCVTENERSYSPTHWNSLAEQLAVRCVTPWEEKTEPGPKLRPVNSEEKFIVSSSNPHNSCITEVKNISKEILDVVQNLTKIYGMTLKKSGKELAEITVDFMKDGKRWVVLKCDKALIDENSKSFVEVTPPISKTVLANFIPMVNTQFPKNNEKIELKNLPSKRYDSPIMHKRTLSTINDANLIRSFSLIKSRNDNLNIEQRIENFIKRTEHKQKRKLLHINMGQEKLIESYEKSFSNLAIHLKNEKPNNAPISQSFMNKSFQDVSIIQEKSNSQQIFKPVIKDYNKMMIHVRRINLKNKRPLMDCYGGEIFWQKFIKTLYSRLLSSEMVSKIFASMHREPFEKMFMKGLGCVFNSNITLEFRREVRTAHKAAKINHEMFKLFIHCFISLLKEVGVVNEDIEIVLDNLNSFSSAIICSGSKKLH